MSWDGIAKVFDFESSFQPWSEEASKRRDQRGEYRQGEGVQLELR